MQTVPSHRSATYAGAWPALGAVPWDTWMSQQAKGNHDVLVTNLITLSFFAVFLLMPMYYFVIGRNTGLYSRFWYLDPKQRAAYWVISKRMFCWFTGAAVFGAIWSFTSRVVLHSWAPVLV